MAGLGLQISIETSKGGTKYALGSGGLKGSMVDEVQNLKDTLISTALTVLKEEQRNGFDDKPRVRVDNKFGKNIFDANPFGKIEFFARQSPIKVLANAYREIHMRSPKVSGQYKESNYVFLNTRLVARNEAEFKSFLKARATVGFEDYDVFRFINVTPYARRLERFGVSAGRQKERFRKSHKRKKGGSGTARIPNGAYALAIRAIRRKSKGTFAGIKFLFHKNGAKGIHIQAGNGFRNSFSTKKWAGQPYLYPMIVLSFSPEGVLQ